MTHAFGGGGDLTLATLYVPVKPETRGLHEEMVRVGEQAGRSLAQGMHSSGLTNIGSAMALGFQQSLPVGFSHAFGELHSQLDHLGQGALQAQTAFDRYTNSMRLTGEAANRTHGEEAKLLNLRNQGTNVAAQITASEAMIAEHYRRGGESSRECQKEEQNLQNLRTKGNTLATQMVVQQGQLSNAQALHTQRIQESTTAHERYNQALEQSHSHLNLGAIGTAALTGAVTGLTFAAVNLASDGLSAVMHGFEGIVRAGVGVGESVIKVGQHFQDLNRQVTLFTTESGSALKDMQDGMRNVYAGLDVPSERLGETFGVLHAQFGFTGEGLEKVSRHLTELGARFGGIDVREFSAMMHQFGIEGVEPVDKALGQLIFDSQKYGVTVQSLQNDMVQMGPIWDALDVNYNSAAMAMSRIEQLGDPARRVMLGLSATAKEMAKGPDPKGTFKQYMQDVLQTGANLEATGGTAMADAFAQSEFSVRNWAILKQTYGIMQDAAHNAGAEGDNIDLEKLILATRTLHEKFTLFFHDVEARLAPLGLNIVEHIGGALDTVKLWFDTHQTEIIGKIKDWGDVFIDNIPKIQHFIGEGIRFIGDFVTFSVKSFGFVGEAIGLLFGNKDMEELGRKITNFDIRPLTDKIGNEIEYGLHIDTGALKSWWDNEAIPGLVKNQPKIEVPTDLKTPDGKSLLDEKQMQEWVKGKGEKIGGALIDGIEKAAKEHMPGWLKWTLEHGSWLVGGVDDAFDDDTPENRNKYWHGGHSGADDPTYPHPPGAGANPKPGWAPPSGQWTTDGGETEPKLPGETSGFTVPMTNAPTSVVLVGKYDPDPHAHETPSAPPGIGAPTWPGMSKSGSRGSGKVKDPKLQAQERQDRLDNARDAKDDADDAYTDAMAAAKVAEEKDKPLIDKFKAYAAAAPAGSKIREGYEEQLNAATTDLTKARHAATHALHAKDRAGRALTEAEMKSEEPEKAAGGDDANMQKLGQSLVPGLMQEMGFGDIFGKAPNQWGVFKMLGGALQWGLKAANAFGAAGIKIGPHGLTMPQVSGPTHGGEPVIVGPQEVSPFGSQRGAAPGPGGQAAPQTMPQLREVTPQRSYWGYTPSPQIARGTALASAIIPNTSSYQPVETVSSGGYAVNPATAAGTLRLGGTTTDAFNDAQRRGVETNAPLYAKGLNTQGYGNSKGLPQWAIDIGAKFGLAPSTYPEGGTLHQAGYAMDFAPIPGNSDPAGSMDRFSTYVKQNLGSQTLELIHDDPKTGQKWGMAGARPVGPGTDMPGYFSSDWGGHQDHVHWATDVPPVQGYQTGGLVGFADGGVQGPIVPPNIHQYDPRFGIPGGGPRIPPKWEASPPGPYHRPDFLPGHHTLTWPVKENPWLNDIPDISPAHPGFRQGGLVGFDGGGHVPNMPDPNDPTGLAPWDLPHGIPRGPVVRYPEGGTRSWDNSHSAAPPPLNIQPWRPPAVPGWGSPVRSTAAPSHATPASTGTGSGYHGAGFQSSGEWLKSDETTAIGSHYKIKSGDTLSDIAQRSGVSISDIQKANNITNPDMINADAIIKLPGGRGWFGTPSSGAVGVSTPSSGFSTQPPIKLSPRTTAPAVIPMSSNDPTGPHRGGETILSRLLRGWLGFGNKSDEPGQRQVMPKDLLQHFMHSVPPWAEPQGFDDGGAAGVYNPPTQYNKLPGFPFPAPTASTADADAQRKTKTGIFNPRFYGKYLPPGNFNPNVQLNTNYASDADASSGDWPFQWPRKRHGKGGGGLYPQAGAWSSTHPPEPFAPWDTSGHANGGLVQRFARGGVVGFKEGGDVYDPSRWMEKNYGENLNRPDWVAHIQQSSPEYNALGGLVGYKEGGVINPGWTGEDPDYESKPFNHGQVLAHIYGDMPMLPHGIMGNHKGGLIGLAKGGVAAADPWVSPDAPYPDTGGAGHDHYSRHTPWWKEDDPGFNIPARPPGPWGTALPPVGTVPPGTLPRHHPKADPRRPQDWHPSHMFAQGGLVQGFQHGGVVGFDQGGVAGGADNFYKRWYPRSQTPTPTASTPMLRPDSLGGLLGGAPTPLSQSAQTPSSAVKPWGVMTRPAPDAAHPLQGFRSLADEHRATGFGRLSRAVSSFTGVLPDVALDYDTLRHWGQHTGMEQAGAVLDTASVIPGLGTLLGAGAGAVGRGAAHGIKALQAARFSRGLPDEFRIASGRLGGAGAAAQQHPRWPQYQKYVNHNEVIGPKLGYLPQKSLSFEEWLRLQDQAELGDEAVEAATRRAAEVKPPVVSTATDLATLQSIVHKPTANSIEMREFVKPWGNANAFQTMQPGVMKGIYDALEGKPGGITPEVIHTIAQWQDNAWRWTAEEYAANTPPEMQEIFRLFGGEVAANMVHGAPTDQSIFRGVAWPHERAETLKKGQILTMNRPASFARDEEAAAEAALFRQEWQHNYEELMTLPERILDVKEPERSILKEKIAKLAGGRRPGNSGAYIDTIGESRVYAPPWDPILWELESGAHVADLSPSFAGWDEQLGMGRFKIADLQRQEPWGLIRGKLQQIGINPDTSGFAYGGLASTDTVPAMLTPGEVVLNKRAVDMIGLDNALGINALGLAGGGEVPVSTGPNITITSDFKQQSLMGALSGISSIAAGLGADFNPKQWNGLLTAPEQRQSAVHYDNSIHITGNTIADPKQQQAAQQERWNSRFETTTGGLPMPSVGSP